MMTPLVALMVMSGSLNASISGCPLMQRKTVLFGMLAFNCVTLFPFALTHLFCYTASGQLVVCHAHNHAITSDFLYLLEGL
jgi:hypothetical protein